jgi:hypothetical protein
VSDKVIICSLGRPFDVTCLDDATVVVSTNNGIEIININSTKTERRITTSRPSRGITHHNGIPFGISNLVCKVRLISLTDFTVGCCITDTICVCLSFVVLIATDGGLVSIDTDPNVVTVDNISGIL